MARPLRIEYPGAFYHITSRGNERKNIFKNEYDFKKFLEYLEAANKRYRAVIHSYCLMSNHYHLLIETPLGNLSQIVRHINGSYTTYFNTKRQRAGHLFQGRYKAILIEADEYAGELSRYIHLNPVRAGIANNPEEYRWSSYQNYIGKKSDKWLTTDFILGYFGGKGSTAFKKYGSFVKSLINREYDSPLKDTVSSTILGGADFIKEIKDKYLSGKEADRDIPALRELKKVLIEDIIKEVEAVFKGKHSLSKKAALYLCHKYSGRTLKEIGDYFGIGESGVSQSSRRFSKELEANKKLSKKVNSICKKLSLCNV
jgi:REP element-mobilizing transposase RayT